MKAKQEKQAQVVFFSQLNEELSLSPHINFKQVDIGRIKPDRYTFFFKKKVFVSLLVIQALFYDNFYVSGVLSLLRRGRIISHLF